jgi:hypothetical protein
MKNSKELEKVVKNEAKDRMNKVRTTKNETLKLRIQRKKE